MTGRPRCGRRRCRSSSCTTSLRCARAGSSDGRSARGARSSRRSSTSSTRRGSRRTAWWPAASGARCTAVRCATPLPPPRSSASTTRSRSSRNTAGNMGSIPSMLAAQGFQESTLDQSKRSRVGAIGVMQLMPATGKALDVGDIAVIEPNIHARAKYMDERPGISPTRSSTSSTRRCSPSRATTPARPTSPACARKRASAGSTRTSGSTTSRSSRPRRSACRRLPTFATSSSTTRPTCWCSRQKTAPQGARNAAQVGTVGRVPPRVSDMATFRRTPRVCEASPAMARKPQAFRILE